MMLVPSIIEGGVEVEESVVVVVDEGVVVESGLVNNDDIFVGVVGARHEPCGDKHEQDHDERCEDGGDDKTLFENSSLIFVCYDERDVAHSASFLCYYSDEDVVHRRFVFGEVEYLSLKG